MYAWLLLKVFMEVFIIPLDTRWTWTSNLYEFTVESYCGNRFVKFLKWNCLNYHIFRIALPVRRTIGFHFNRSLILTLLVFMTLWVHKWPVAEYQFIYTSRQERLYNRRKFLDLFGCGRNMIWSNLFFNDHSFCSFII